MAKARLEKIYRDTIVSQLKETLGLANVMEVPKITKIVVNMGVGEAVADKKIMDNAVADLTKITGQKPLVTRARKSVATFKVRDGLAIGAKVTLRGARMYEFLDRLVSIAMPRIRDFRGVSVRSTAAATTTSASRNRSFSPRSPTTRSMRSAAWTSRSRRQRATTRQGARCSKPSTSPSASRATRMAKTSMVNREVKRTKLVKRYAAK